MLKIKINTHTNKDRVKKETMYYSSNKSKIVMAVLMVAIVEKQEKKQSYRETEREREYQQM